MCRLFGQISAGPLGASDFLAKSRYSLLAQSTGNKKHPQADGWGIAHLQDQPEDPWRLEKSARPVFKESARFKKSAGGFRSRITIAHIRYASNPKKLPKRALIGVQNNQPYAANGIAFAHNGTLNIPDAVARRLGKYRKRIRGNNDSEVLFWLFLKCWEENRRLKGSKRWLKTFKAMASEIRRAWNALPKKKRRHSVPAQGLNFLVSNGSELAAHCSYHRADGRSLCGQGRPYFEMCYKILENKIVAASEPLDRTDGWRALPNGRALIIEREARGLKAHLERLS